MDKKNERKKMRDNRASSEGARTREGATYGR